MRRLIAAGWMAALAPACDNAGDRVCLLLGCDSGAGFDVGDFREPDHAALRGATVQVCLNEACVTGIVDELPDHNEVVYRRLGSQVDPRVELSLWRTDQNATDLIEVQLSYASDEPALFADGDIYTVDLMTAAGLAIVSKAWRAPSYVTRQPNGPDCEPTCRNPVALEPIESP